MRKSIIAIMTAVAALASVSCDKLLNPRQIDIIYNEVFWEKQVDAEVGISGVYALYRGLMASPMNWYDRADATTGFIKSGWNGGSASGLYTVGNYTDITATNKMWGGLESWCDWSAFYKVIAQANLVIAKVEKMDEKVFEKGVKKRILGEAYFLRALTYFNILRIWGNAPYISDSIESSSQVINKDLTPVLIERTSDIEIAANVIADVNLAVEYLDYELPGSSRWGIFANKGAAEALCGEVNMWMWFLAKRDRLPGRAKYLTDAIAALENVEKHSGAGFLPAYTEDSIKQMYLGQSIEAIFECNISTDQNESYRADLYGITSRTCKMTSFNGDPTKDRSTQVDWVPYGQKAKMYPEYDFATGTGDIRPNLFFGAWDSEYNEAVNDVGGVTNDRSKVTWLKKYAQFTEDTYRKQDEYVAYFALCNIPVFRYTGEMLLLAEAYCRNDEPGKAKDIIDRIRQRAGLEPYSGSMDDLLNEVLQQFIGEMFGEGRIYFDMVRNNNFPNEHLMTPAAYREKAYYWPVSSSILSMNTKVSQTPYWNGKTRW